LLARVLMTLAAVSGDQTLEERAAKIVAFAPHALVRVPSPVLIGQLLSAVEVQLGPRRTVVVVGPKSPARAALAAAAARRWGAVLFVVDSEGGSEEAGDLALLSNKQAAANSPLAYVCDERGCSAPVADPEKLARLVDPPGGRAAPGTGIDGTHSQHLYA
jgi:uncharacterized protein YyaL (SSP411 family)